jgi:hypothetical protein
MTVPNPLYEDEAEAWDVVYLAGQRMPGRAIVAGASSLLEWEEQKGDGTNGATLKYKGAGLPEFTIELEFWEPEHFEEWETRKQLVAVPKGDAEPQALDFGHPVGTDLDIPSIVVLGRTQLEPKDDTGLWGVEIKAKKWAKPEPKVGTPGKSSATPDKKAAGTIHNNEVEPKDEADKMIERLVKEIEKEAAK